MSASNLVASVNAGLAAALAEDERVVMYGQDIGRNGGVFQATAGLQEQFGERRVFDAPLAECAIVGTAIGMAVAGLRPIVEMQFSGFVYPAFNQIISHVARFRSRTRGAMGLPMVIRMPYGGAVSALEHHSESMEAIFGHIPGLKVVIPSTPHDAKGLLLAAVRDPDPVIFMEPKRLYHSPQQEIPDGSYELPLGRARVVEAGDDITVVAYGGQMRDVRAAVAHLKRRGTMAELIDLRTIYPFDQETILESVRKTGRLLVVHEGPRSFGVGAEIVSFVTEQAFMYLDAAPRRLTGSDAIIPLPASEHLYFLQPEHIADAIMETLSA
jgi:pyruvate dehydrogenase E1 component beta subunit